MTAHAQRRDGGLAGGGARGRGLHAVIHGVAHDVQQRLEQHLDDGLVGLSVLAFEHKAGGLIETDRKFAHDARESLEDRSQGKDA